MYLTPDKYRTMGFGIDLSDLEDVELASLCSQASAIIDSYCRVPRMPQKHDFRGGVITGEEHNWRYPMTPFELGQRRYYFWHWPVISIAQFRIYVTNTQYLEVAPTELVINNSERYAEVVSLAVTSSGLFNALIVPNIGLATPKAVVNYSYGWRFSVVNETLYATDGRTYRASNQFWHSTPAPTIYRNGVAITTDFTIDYEEGTVVFNAQQPTDDVIRATYDHKLPADIMQAAGFIVTHLHGEAELRAKGMDNVRRLTVAEVTIERNPEPSGSSMSDNLEYYAPEAAALLGAYRADNIAVRL